MRNTDIVIMNQGIRPLGNLDDSSYNTTRVYIQCNYIKKELKSHYNSNESIEELKGIIRSKRALNVTDVQQKITDKVDYLTSAERVAEIHHLVEEMEYLEAVKKIFK